MITVRVQGGLGNQMFIYAAGRSWALSNNTELALDMINGGYGADERFGRSYGLGNYKIVATSADRKTIAKHRPATRGYYWRRKLNSLLPLRLRSLILEPRRYNPLLPHAQLRKDAYLAGYWQREEYFRKYAHEIRQELQLGSPMGSEIQTLADRLRNGPSVFVHIRRQEYGYKLTPEYYRSAVELVSSSVPSAKFFVFGDDATWARAQLTLPSDTCYMDDLILRSEIEDLWLMTQCKHAIIANSSFSWWGAWLRNSEECALTIAPANWGYAGQAIQEWHTLSCSMEQDSRYV